MRTACVVGLGKIGLPLAVQIASAGWHVTGSDISERVVAQVNEGEPPFPGEAGLDERLREVVSSGRLSATTDTPGAVAASEVVVVVVPLVVDEEARPEFGAIDSATRDVGNGLRAGTLVSFETTLPVGTTRRRFAPMLAELSGLEPGRDVFVCHSPERVLTGRVFADLRRYPKLIGGIDDESARRAADFYASVLTFDERSDLERGNGVWDLGSAEAAELAKLAETTYRDVNIGLANEFARYADAAGIDVYSVIEAANSQPYSHVHRPGIAVGGHCIPVYPRFYLANHPDAAIPAAARRVNDSMPAYAATQLRDAMGGLGGARIAILGAAYRGGVKETAFSGVFTLAERLRTFGAEIRVHDPMFDDAELEALGFEPYHLGDPCDAAVIQADHAGYSALGPGDLPGVKALLDGRRVTEAGRWDGVRRIVIGSPA